MFVVLTGNPGVGKSMVNNYLQEIGFTTYKIDDYINEIYQIGRIGYQLIKENFGEKFVNLKSVNKDALAALVIKNNDAYKKLNQLIWPIIKNHLLKLKHKYKNLIVEMAIYKLDENFFSNIFDFVIEVINENVKYQKNQNNNIKKYENWYIGKKLNKVDFIINNSWTIDYTQFVISKLMEIIN